MLTSAAEAWAYKRNLKPRSEREFLIYLLGRLGKEPLPPELMIFVAERMPPQVANEQ